MHPGHCWELLFSSSHVIAVGVASLPCLISTAMNLVNIACKIVFSNQRCFNLLRTSPKLYGLVSIFHTEFQVRRAGGCLFLAENRIWRRETYLQTVPCLPRALSVRNRRGSPCSSGRWLLWKGRTVCTGVCVGRMLCDEGICSLRLWFCFKILQVSK